MKRYLLTLLIGAFALMGRADEGMWLLQLLEQQHTIDMMKKAGLRLEASDIYSATDASIKDAVGIFGGGCTGEVISKEGLILTNHHCGYSYLQQLSTVDNDYLKNGFWTHSKSEELPVPGLTFTFVESITDMTEIISRDIKNGRKDEIQVLSNTYLDSVAQSWFRTSIYYGKTGYHVELLPYFAGNSYYLVLYREYGDVRLVAAPPTSIGKFGGETDNWMWPRHTGDFSMFRVYMGKDGKPAAYSKDNIPYVPKHHLPVSLDGVKQLVFEMDALGNINCDHVDIAVPILTPQSSIVD